MGAKSAEELQAQPASHHLVAAQVVRHARRAAARGDAARRAHGILSGHHEQRQERDAGERPKPALTRTCLKPASPDPTGLALNQVKKRTLAFKYGLKWLGKLVKEGALDAEASPEVATSTLEKLRSKGAAKEDVRYGSDDTGEGGA